MTLGRRANLFLALACFALAFGLVLWAWRARTAAHDRSSFLERLIGPFAGLVASAQWVRADVALRESRYAVAYRRAETALAISPEDPQGWIFYASQLLFQRTALALDGAPEERVRWARAGIDVLGRAERECAHPGPIWLYEGLVFAAWAELPDDRRPWPGAAREAWSRAVEAFARARELGEPQAAELERLAREKL